MAYLHFTNQRRHEPNRADYRDVRIPELDTGGFVCRNLLRILSVFPASALKKARQTLVEQLSADLVLLLPNYKIQVYLGTLRKRLQEMMSFSHSNLLDILVGCPVLPSRGRQNCLRPDMEFSRSNFSFHAYTA
jgi:hypothetical protein